MDPLFSTLVAVKAALRLSGVSSAVDADIDALIDLGVRKVRVNFRKALGHERITTIKAYSQAASPETNNEYIRELAEITEIDWVRLELTFLLPMLFMDSSSDQREVYNEEAPFRKMSMEELRRLRSKLKTEVETNLDVLSGEKDIEESGSFRTVTIEPTSPRRVGDSLNESL